MTKAHVVSLELAKQMKEAGWKKETEFWWAVHKRVNEPDYTNCINLVYGNSEFYPAEHWECVNAPLATELLEELPVKIRDGNWDSYLVIKPKWSIHYKTTWWMKRNFQNITKEDIFHLEQDDSFPNALAKMWLYLKKEGLL